MKELPLGVDLLHCDPVVKNSERPIDFNTVYHSVQLLADRRFNNSVWKDVKKRSFDFFRMLERMYSRNKLMSVAGATFADYARAAMYESIARTLLDNARQSAYFAETVRKQIEDELKSKYGEKGYERKLSNLRYAAECRARRGDLSESCVLPSMNNGELFNDIKGQEQVLEEMSNEY